jgi:hypothetical protein
MQNDKCKMFNAKFRFCIFHFALEPVSKPSFPRRRDSNRTILSGLDAIPACAGMTAVGFETGSKHFALRRSVFRYSVCLCG